MTSRVGGRVGIVQVRYPLVPILGNSTPRIELRHKPGLTSHLKLNLERIGGIRRVGCVVALVDQEQRYGTTSRRNVRKPVGGNPVVHDMQFQAAGIGNVLGPARVLSDPKMQVDRLRLPCPDIDGLTFFGSCRVMFILVVAPANRHVQ